MPIRKDGKIKVAAITKDGKIKTVAIPEYCMCSDCASKPPSKKCVCPFCASSEDDDDDKSLGEWDLPSDYIGKLPDWVWEDMEKGELPEKKKAETTTDIKKAKNTSSGSSHRLYMRRMADKYLKPIQFPLDEIEVLYFHHNHHRDDPDDQDSTEDEGSMKSRTKKRKKKKKMMPRMEKKLSRTENMSLKGTTLFSLFYIF
ncbi:hypothetical protein QL285_017298 [Trifolium repens]|nr:hypothetical protein QL285_017298 [Trifolium repens]